MSGGGDGCYYPDKERTSEGRRVLHAGIVLGFLSAFASTTLASAYQHFLELMPPYALTSLPVILGSVGGVAMIIGSTGLLVLKLRASRGLIAPSMLRMDTAFLIVFGLVSITGMLLLALRDTRLMPSMLLVHLATLAALYATIPYGKFAHVVYRLLVLFQNRRERLEEERSSRKVEPSTQSVPTPSQG
jgi:citrate/tricarballylate utilization protein